jgi:hypothetical protein
MRKLVGLLLLCLPLVTLLALAQEPVPSTFFGMHAHAGAVHKQPWPSAPFGAFRLWDSQTKWLHLNPRPGVYDWDVLDRYLDMAEQHHLDVIYTFGGVPTWASADRNDGQCRENMPGSCHPPVGLSEDGSGDNQAWKDFVTAIAKHAHGRIKYWEVWNEPHNLFFWHGTMGQMVRMTQDLRTIVKGVDPGAMIISPGTGWHNPHEESGKTDWNPLNWTSAYLAAGGKKYIDIVGIHVYLTGECPSGVFDSSQFPVRLEEVRNVMKKNGVADMPIWSTEGSWGKVSKFCTGDPDMQVAFVGQYYISGWANGLQRMYWYAWNDGDTGMLWDQRSERIEPAGKAYGEVYRWMVGATLGGCENSKSQTSCTFTRPDDSQYLAIWDRSQTCSGGNCTTTQVKVDPKYVDYLDLAGGKNKIQDSTVPVGMKPIWLEAPAGSSGKKPAKKS